MSLDDERARWFEAVVHGVPDFVAFATEDGRVQFVNHSGRRLVGLDDETDVGELMVADFLPDGVAAASGELADVLSTGSWTGVSMLRDWRGGPSIPVAVTTFVARHQDTGETLGVATVRRDLRPSLLDVTARRRAEAAERAQAAVLELIAGEAPIREVLRALALAVEQQLDDTICTVLLVEGKDAEAVFRHGASPSMPEGYQTALEGRAIEGDPSPCGLAVRSREPVLVEDISTDVRFTPMRQLALACNVRSCWSYPVVSPTTDALLGTFALYTRTPGMPDDRAAAIVARASRLVAIAVDRQALVSRLAHLAQHDELTGLRSRLALLDRLSDQLERAPDPGSVGPVVVFLDLDRLKIVNDSLGHEVGDELLVRIAERLPDAVPDGSLVARFGGDEFVVLVDRLDGQQQAADLAEHVLAAIAAPVALAGRTVTPSASAGLVIATRGQSAVDVIRDAEIAMYRAKTGGGVGHALVTPDMRMRAFDRLDLEEQIRHGLAHGEFRVFYQPVVDLRRADALIGFEALVRWQHSERGLLGPASFIHLAEETGLIVELGDWVLRSVATTAGGWTARFPGLSGGVAVNLAYRQLVTPGLAESVRRAMAEMGSWSLGLELTESSLMSDTERTRAIVDELVELGAWLAIDDFGTGFSSLAYLTRLPVQMLKIDRTFVQDLVNPGGQPWRRPSSTWPRAWGWAWWRRA